MKKAAKIFEAGVLAVFAVLVAASPVFAAIDSNCIGKSGFENVASDQGNGAPEGFPVKCNIKVNDGSDITHELYGKTKADCVSANANSSNNSANCKSDDLNDVIKNVINAIIFAIGIIAVIMIILGGISYATSQGDPAKVKKGKDTILYGIIGLVVALLAYAIVNFVLGALNG